MTLLITVIAAVISSAVWYFKDNENRYKVGTLTLMYWGASIMWMCDAVAEYIELRSAYFTPAMKDMINDSFLGISVVTFGLVIWLVMLIVSDPDKAIKKNVCR
ncbi:MAG: hypothetical protein PUB67_06455 [Clostridiales bacterium]|nr:hypothetical protein [Clostridiales bacterium]